MSFNNLYSVSAAKNKKENKMLDLVSEQDAKRLIKDPEGTVKVAIDFNHLDQLVGSLCHVMDLNSDREYREHIKSEVKMRCRQWLQDQYDLCGYDSNNPSK